MGLSWQLHVFDLRSVYGDRLWYGRLLRRKSAIPFFGTAARLLALPLNHGAAMIPPIGPGVKPLGIGLWPTAAAICGEKPQLECCWWLAGHHLEGRTGAVGNPDVWVSATTERPSLKEGVCVCVARKKYPRLSAGRFIAH